MARQRWRPTPRRIPVATPAVGADWSRRNDSGGGWLVRGTYAELTTSAVVNNREVNIRASDGSNVWFRTAVGVAQTASLTQSYCTFPGAVAAGVTTVVRPLTWPTDGLWLPPGDVVQAVTLLIDAGDQWANIMLDVIEFPDVLPVHLLPMPALYEEDSQE